MKMLARVPIPAPKPPSINSAGLKKRALDAIATSDYAPAQLVQMMEAFGSGRDVRAASESIGVSERDAINEYRRVSGAMSEMERTFLTSDAQTALLGELRGRVVVSS